VSNVEKNNLSQITKQHTTTTTTATNDTFPSLPPSLPPSFTHPSRRGGHRLLGARRQADLGGASVLVLGHNHGVPTGGTGKGTWGGREGGREEERSV